MTKWNVRSTGLRALAVIVLTSLTAHGAPQQQTVAQRVRDGSDTRTQSQDAVRQASLVISRTPEGITLGGSKADVLKQIKAHWGSDYLPLNIVWNPYWYPRSARSSSGRFSQRNCGGSATHVPICEGTILRSTTTSLIEILTFQDRVFRIIITLPSAPDYRLQAQNMMDLLRQKYGTPSQGSRWRDSQTELSLHDLTPGWPTTLQYDDLALNAEVQRGAERFIEARKADIEKRSRQVPRGY